jgi:cell division protein FtsB
MTQTDSRRHQNSEGGGSKKLAFATAVLALLTAGFGVLSAYLGVQTAQLSKEQKEAAVAAQSAGAQASTLQTENGQLQNKNNQLQSENNSLRSQLGAPTAATEPGLQPSVRHAGKAQIAAGGPGVDLDAPSSDVQWGTTGANGETADVGYSDSTSLHILVGRFINLDSAKADYETCSTRTGYVNVYYGGARVAVTSGSYLCLQTSDSRYSAVKIVSIDRQGVALDMVTYDPPFK